MMGSTFGYDYTSIHHRFQVALQSPTVDLGAQVFKILYGQISVLLDVADGLGLTARKSMLFDEYVPSDGLFATVSDLGKLGCQTFDEVFPTSRSCPFRALGRSGSPGRKQACPGRNIR